MVFFESLGFAAANSLHCAGMCGPLAALFPGGRSGWVGYHSCRVLSYSLLGALAGSIGSLGRTETFAQSGGFSLFLGGMMLLFACGLGQQLVSLPGLGKAMTKVMQRSRGLPDSLRAGLLGACTPFLPCGLLYAAVAAALLTGNAQSGALSMLAFALGSCPLLLVAQMQLGWLRRHLGPRGLLMVSRITLSLAGGVLLWRGWTELSGALACH